MLHNPSVKGQLSENRAQDKKKELQPDERNHKHIMSTEAF